MTRIRSILIVAVLGLTGLSVTGHVPNPLSPASPPRPHAIACAVACVAYSPAPAPQNSQSTAGPRATEPLTPPRLESSMIVRPRAVVPQPSMSYEEQLLALSPILAALPHLSRNDATKLKYFCPADFNKDDVINAEDFSLFLQAISDESHPLSNWTDINGDGIIDQRDLEDFTRMYFSNDCDTEQSAFYRAMICWSQQRPQFVSTPAVELSAVTLLAEPAAMPIRRIALAQVIR